MLGYQLSRFRTWLSRPCSDIDQAVTLSAYYSSYLQRDQIVQRANRQDKLLLTEDANNSELSDAKLYRTALAVLDTDLELTQYLQQERLRRDTNIYQYARFKDEVTASWN
jgi:hypothetical protein